MSSTKIDISTLMTPELEVLVKVFKKHGHEIRIVGGAVRDLLLNQGGNPDDIDLATTATPSEMKDLFVAENIRTFNEQGEKHGTVSARILDNANFEVTTLRIDKVTDGRHAEVEFTKDWRIDAERRDLTVNSMFLGLDGTLYDFFGGRQDLQSKRVAFVGNAAERIREDYLRILRYFRFYGRLADNPDKHEQETLDAIKDNVHGLERISGERIWSEWKKILAGRFAGPLTHLMIDLGLNPYIGLPKNPDVNELDRIWKMTEGSPLQSVPLMVSLLNSQEEMIELNKRLKMSGYERDMGLFVVEHRQDHGGVLLHWQRLLVGCKNKPDDARQFIQETLKYRGDLEVLQEFCQWEMPRFPVTGQDMKEAGIPPGRSVGMVLEGLKEKWMDSEFNMTREQLIQVELPQVMDSVSERMRTPSKKKKLK